MSIEEMTQEEWDEHHKQLDKHLSGVEERHIARLGVAMGFDREWVGLTDEEVCEAVDIDEADAWLFKAARAIEAKLKEKNT
jgi:hypothetical protein